MAKAVHMNQRVIGASVTGYTVTASDAACLHFDEHTNPTLAGAINADPTAYSVVDGVLTKDGVPVVINSPCDDCAALDALDGATTVAQLRKVLLLWRDKPGFTRG